MFIDATVMRETADRVCQMSNLDYSIQTINRDIVGAANKGMTQVTIYIGWHPVLTEHERSLVSLELKKHGYKCRWYACGKPNCRLYISWRNA